MTVSDDLSEVRFTVLGTVTTPQEGALCTVKAGSRVAKVWEGLVVVHHDEPPMLIRWNGTHERLELTSNGAIALPPIPAPDVTISQVVRAMFDMEAYPTRTSTTTTTANAGGALMTDAHAEKAMGAKISGYEACPSPVLGKRGVLSVPKGDVRLTASPSRQSLNNVSRHPHCHPARVTGTGAGISSFE